MSDAAFVSLRNAPNQPIGKSSKIAPLAGAALHNSAADIHYDYEWQKPKAAIYVDKAPVVDLFELGQEQEFLSWVKLTLSRLPRFIRLRLASRIDSIHTMKGRHIARQAVRDIIRRELPPINMVNAQYAIAMAEDAKSQAETAFKKLNPLYHVFDALRGLVERFNRLPDFTPEDVELLAQDIAIYMRSVLSEAHETVETQSDCRYAGYLYTEAAQLARLFFLTPPSWEKYCRGKLFIDEATTGISKMLDDRYWHRNLKKYATRWREHLHIAFGDVKRGAAPYCSKHHVEEWDARRKRSRAIMARLELEDQETKERISLIDQIDKSISNPALRRVELMTRIGGFEKVATESGYAGQFFTMTAPSKYHAYTVFGHRNGKWNGASPRATQRYLNRVWQQIRAELARREIPVFGLRVAESHHDGTPHWHGLLFSLPEHSTELLEVMEDYATREDEDELQGKHGIRPRFEMKPIDHEIGSATGYVVKYISKNIDGYALDGETDDESGRPLKETSKHATAWASCWGIRQFQFLGGAPVSVWRELRRFRNQEKADQINPLFAELHRAADAGDWQQYTQLQGGALVARCDLPLRIWYQQKDQPNDHGEYQILIKGLVMPHTFIQPIETRLHSYRIVRKKPEILDDSGKAVDLAVDLKGASAPSRTRVINCTEVKKYTDSGPKNLPPDEPEQYVIGQMTQEQKKRVNESLRNYKPERQKSPADVFESLANAITASDCDEVDQARAENYMKVAAAIRNEVPTRKNSSAQPVPLTGSLSYQLAAWDIKSELSIHALRCGASLSFGDQLVYLKDGYLVEKTKASYCRARNCNAELTADDKSFGNEGLCLVCTAKLTGTEVIEQRRRECEQRHEAERKQENAALLERFRGVLVNRGERG